MRLRCVLFAVLALTGCESLRSSRPGPVARPVNPMVVSEPVAAMVALAAEAPGADAPGSPGGIDSLTLFGESLARGDDAAACHHLEDYVREHPDQPLFRVQLADLLQRTGEADRGRVHLDRFTADARECGKPLWGPLVSAHTRLMDLAALDDDPFAEALHRGLGLLVLVEQQDADAERDEAFREQLLCKAVKSLTEAKRLRPEDARVRLALAEAFTRMGNVRAADAERRAARNATRPGSLAASDQRRLAIP
jgi:predicted Zn-dependent protease